MSDNAGRSKEELWKDIENGLNNVVHMINITTEEGETLHAAILLLKQKWQRHNFSGALAEINRILGTNFDNNRVRKILENIRGLLELYIAKE